MLLVCGGGREFVSMGLYEQLICVEVFYETMIELENSSVFEKPLQPVSEN